jgi:prepilin-type N-terminal cleavage/methylation domain-containing protein
MIHSNQTINRQQKAQRGYSLVELSIALAIAAVIMVAAVMGTRQILLTNSVNNQIKDSASVNGKIQRHFLSQPSTTDVTNANLVPLGFWPQERANTTNNTVRGLISGTSEAVGTNKAAIGNLATNTGYLYMISQVPIRACAELVSGLDGIAYATYVAEGGSGSLAAVPTGTAVKAANAATFSPTTLATACAASGTATTVDITLAMRLQ